MKTQALLLPLLTLASLMAAPAFADCVLIRQYQDEKRIMQHFSTQTLREGNNIDTSCTTACRKEAVYIPAIDAAKLRGNEKVKDVLLRCSYTVGRGAKPESGRVLAESTIPVTSLRIRNEAKPQRHNAAPYAISPRAPATVSNGGSQQKQNYEFSPRHPQNFGGSASSPYAQPTRPTGTTQY